MVPAVSDVETARQAESGAEPGGLKHPAKHSFTYLMAHGRSTNTTPSTPGIWSTPALEWARVRLLTAASSPRI